MLEFRCLIPRANKTRRHSKQTKPGAGSPYLQVGKCKMPVTNHGLGRTKNMAAFFFFKSQKKIRLHKMTSDVELPGSGIRMLRRSGDVFRPCQPPIRRRLPARAGPKRPRWAQHRTGKSSGTLTPQEEPRLLRSKHVINYLFISCFGRGSGGTSPNAKPVKRLIPGFRKRKETWSKLIFKQSPKFQ